MTPYDFLVAGGVLVALGSAFHAAWKYAELGERVAALEGKKRKPRAPKPPVSP